MDEFARIMQTNSLRNLKTSTDLANLKKELVLTEKSMPVCVAESLFRTNKISIIKLRIKELEDEIKDYMCVKE
jgi:hypothetical protein